MNFLFYSNELCEIVKLQKHKKKAKKEPYIKTTKSYYRVKFSIFL